MRYTIRQFEEQYPDEEACVREIFDKRYGALKECPKCDKPFSFYRVKARKCYACQSCGYQISPLAGTIFHKSPTPLKLWFFGIFLFSTSRNGVSAKELERQLGVTYKCAWRMARQIRLLMGDDNTPLSGEVEVDETYIGGAAKNNMRKKNVTIKDKEVIFGMVERGGRIKARHLKSAGARVILPEIQEHIEPKTTIYSDYYGVYRTLQRRGFNHSSVNHLEKFVDGLTHTNTIEGFWSQMKRSIKGTYHWVSPKHLQHYADEFAWRYSNRKNPNPMFISLLERVWTLAQ